MLITKSVEAESYDSSDYGNDSMSELMAEISASFDGTSTSGKSLPCTLSIPSIAILLDISQHDDSFSKPNNERDRRRSGPMVIDSNDRPRKELLLLLPETLGARPFVISHM